MVSSAQLKALAITPKITATISIPCSLFIIVEVLRSNRRHKAIPIQRAVMAMSVFDVLASSGWWLSTWAVPKDTEVPVAFAAGNTGSCVYQGILLQLAIGAPLYNASLALYYVLIIRYGWTNRELIKIEPYVHTSILLFTFGTAFGLIPLKIYNHIGTVCWIIGKPQGCGNSTFEFSDVPCERGDWAWAYGIALFYGPLWLCVAFSIGAMILIYMEVRGVAQRNRRYLGNRASGLRSSVDPKQVALQAALYTAAFFITWLPSTIWSIATWFSFAKYWLDFLSAFSEPLQGFWNMLVFIRKRRDLHTKLKGWTRMVFCCTKDPFVQAVSSTMESAGDDYGASRSIRFGGLHGSVISQNQMSTSSARNFTLGHEEAPTLRMIPENSMRHARLDSVVENGGHEESQKCEKPDELMPGSLQSRESSAEESQSRDGSVDVPCQQNVQNQEESDCNLHTSTLTQ